MKKIIIVAVIVLLVLLIYQKYKDRKIYYVNIGDNMLIQDNYAKILINKMGEQLEEYNLSFTDFKYQTTDLINLFNDNTKVDNKTIKNVLIKADLLTISIGLNDLDREHLTQEYIDEYLKDLDVLLKLARTWCKEKIILIGVNNQYANQRLKNKADEYNLIYIDIYN